ncbi:MAG: hypothetical protein ACI9G1_001099 [Pirellulaceae bacterium]|jgi:hypothetical protein
MILILRWLSPQIRSERWRIRDLSQVIRNAMRRHSAFEKLSNHGFQRFGQNVVPQILTVVEALSILEREMVLLGKRLGSTDPTFDTASS